MLIILLYFAIVSGDGQFECGEHGRFEYCIDEIPGCVIGCHCHPGYYFDTESKICEPNIKLTQNYRRYLQSYEPKVLPTESSQKAVEITGATAISTTRDLVDYQVDEITKNADDIGDWLYNQFFKTIESEVINNTKGNKVPNRRSGTVPLFKNISRRKASYKKNRKSKRKKNKSSMRRKLLRITENDSVFDSSSESRSDTSESSSDESENSFEIERDYDRHNDDREHGHKKIVIINKKPKPPLPSFIFLPNMDTPFYPPIGLPPPPVMPMYPIVPVPPMPAFPCPEQDENVSSTTAAATVATTAGTTSLATSPASIRTSVASIPTEQETVETSTNSDKATTVSKKLYRGGRFKKRYKEKISQPRNSNSEDFNGHKDSGLQGQREKLRIRQKYRNSALKRPVQDFDLTENSFNEDNVLDSTLNNEIQPNPYRNLNKRLDNVDFKYISELIHRAKLNDTRKPIESLSPTDSVEVYKSASPYEVKQQTANIPKKTTRRDDPDDLYYTNLGRQIASIIRSADAQNRQVNIEIEHTNQNNENHVYFNDANSPKSFWERSVRSPVTFLNSNKNRFDYLKKSNELLFDIENKVSIVASTMPSLSLHEIENMINVVEKAQRKINNSPIGVNNVKESSRNFNINLWPRDTSENHKFQQGLLENKTRNSNFKKMPEMHGVSMHNFQRFTAWLSTGQTNQTQNNKIYKINTRNPAKNANYSSILLTPPPVNLRLSQPKGQWLNNSTSLKYPILQRQNFDSMLPKYKYNTQKKKYFQDISNGQDDDGSLIPMKHVIHQLVNKQPVQQPSYFHRGINHFDYF